MLQFRNYEEIIEILDYIELHISDPLLIDTLAEKSYLSPRRFRYIFKQITGQSPKAYICELKLKKVTYLLTTTNNNLTTIAIEMGYSSPFQLSRDFKKYFGVSPKEYRKYRYNDS